MGVYLGPHNTPALVLVDASNVSGKRKYSEDEILNSLRSGEGIVCATGNRGIT